MRSLSFLTLLLATALFAAACATDEQIATGDGNEELGDLNPGEGSAGSGSEETPPPTEKIVDHDFQVQQTGYWCGPAATRVALSARITPPSQQTLANELPTTTNGTDWIGQVTATLNDYLGPSTYVTVEMPNDPPTTAQRERLWDDLLRTIDGDHIMVANIVAPPGNQPPGYPSNQTIYHYFAVV